MPHRHLNIIILAACFSLLCYDMNRRVRTAMMVGDALHMIDTYYVDPVDQSVIAGTTDYGISMCSMVIKDNLIATQFHPEKSGDWGLKMYSNFLKMALDEVETQ